MGLRRKLVDTAWIFTYWSPGLPPIEVEFPGFGMAGSPDEALRFSQTLLFWIDETVHVDAVLDPGVFEIRGTDALLDSAGGEHQIYTTFQDYRRALLLRSTTILYRLEPAQTMFRTFPPDWTNWVATGPAWPHTHTLDVSTDEVYLNLVDGLRKLETITINGFLQWQHKRDIHEFHIMRRVADGEAFAGALIALGPEEGQMFAFTISDSPRAGVHLIRLDEKHWNAIRKLKLDLPAGPA